MANDMAQRLMTRVRELRLSLGLSQEAFAERAGLKYKHYQAVEAGRKPKIQLPTLVKLAEALDMELWELLKFEVKPPVLVADAKKADSRPASVKSVHKLSKHRSAAKKT